MMLLQIAAGAHPLSGTVAEWVWLLPVLPLLGFVINGALSLVPAFHAGPANPDVGHADPHGEDAVISHAENEGAHGDDNHALMPHRYAGIVSIIGPGVLAISFLLAWMMFSAMRAASPDAPLVQRYFTWMLA